MLELVLWLFSLFRSLLFLDDRESVFWLVNFYILTLALSPLVFGLDGALLVIHCIYSRWDAIISNGLSGVPLGAPNAQRFLVTRLESLLIVIVHDVHRKRLGWKPVCIVSAILRHLVDLKSFHSRLSA